MKKPFFLCFSIFLSLFAGLHPAECSQKQKIIDPCSLIEVEQLCAVFPILQKAEKQSVGPETVCNYLDKMGIPALIVSVTMTRTGVHESLSKLGPGYVIEDIPGLGDESAIAIQQPNPKFGLQEEIAALLVKKGATSLNFSFFRIKLKPGDSEFEKIKTLAAEMIGTL